MNTTESSWSLPKVKNVLFPTDFSSHSGRAMSYALAFAKDLSAKVHVLHVIDTSVHWEEQPYEPEQQRRPGYTIQDEVEAKVEELAQKARDAGVEAERHWRQGSTRDETLRLIDELDIGLVVMGTHARNKPDIVLRGSVYSEIVHDADVPVIAIKHPEHEFLLSADSSISIDRVICPCDLTSFSHSAVPIAAGLCRHYNSELVLAHLAHTYEEYMALKGLGGKPAAKVDTYETLNHLLDPYDDIASRIVVLKGKPELELIELCKQENADLVVMTTHGRTPAMRSIVGSVAERLVVDGPCPVITIRPERMAERFSVVS